MLTLQIEEFFELSKHINILKSDIKVMSPNGLRKIYDVDITSYNSVVIIIRTKKHELMCSPDHLIKSNNKWVKAKEFRINDIVDTKYGPYNIKEIIISDKKEDLLDLHVDGHEYFTNDIISHNSTLQESIDYTLFGVVRGKERKRIPQIELPNRINGSLLTSIKFLNENNEEVNIKRGLKPSKFEIFKDKNDITSSYKKYDQERKEDIIGMNYDIYKSFISMSLNDFKNFINLEPETKRKLLNKLFNLEEIDKYFEITKEIIRDNKKNIEKIELDIYNNKNTIETYKENIENIIKNTDSYKSREEIKDIILKDKNKFIELKSHIGDLKKELIELTKDLENRKKILNGKKYSIEKTNLKIEDYDNKISIFKGGICPTCNTNLKSENHKHNLEDIVNKKQEFVDEKNEINEDIINYKKESKYVFLERKEILKELNEKKSEYDKLSNNLNYLKRDFDNFNVNNKAVVEINKNIKKLENKNNELGDILNDLENKTKNYEILNRMFSVYGIRKNIISNTIKPINNYISKYLKELDSDFRVEIDNEFNANIYERHINKIHPESLSSGESRKINMALSLSYLEIIRKVRKCNILFLDEIFANVDVENIDLLIKSLKKFALKYGINIVVISQDDSPFNMSLFDRIISINKNMFSMITDEKINSNNV